MAGSGSDSTQRKIRYFLLLFLLERTIMVLSFLQVLINHV